MGTRENTAQVSESTSDTAVSEKAKAKPVSEEAGKQRPRRKSLTALTARPSRLLTFQEACEPQMDALVLVHDVEEAPVARPRYALDAGVLGELADGLSYTNTPRHAGIRLC